MLATPLVLPTEKSERKWVGKDGSWHSDERARGGVNRGAGERTVGGRKKRQGEREEPRGLSREGVSCWYSRSRGRQQGERNGSDCVVGTRLVSMSATE